MKEETQLSEIFWFVGIVIVVDIMTTFHCRVVADLWTRFANQSHSVAQFYFNFLSSALFLLGYTIGYKNALCIPSIPVV